MLTLLRRSVSLTISDLKVSFKRSESLLVTAAMPIIALIALSFTDGGLHKYLPFIFVQSSMASALLSLGITTGFDRRYRVLVRLGTTPIGNSGIVISKILYVFIFETIQLFLTVGIALGFRPSITILLALPFCWLASISFASIALIISSKLKAETNLGVQNLTYIVLLAISSISFLSKTNDGEAIMLLRLVPSSALHSLLRYATNLNDFSLTAFLSVI